MWDYFPHALIMRGIFSHVKYLSLNYFDIWCFIALKFDRDQFAGAYRVSIKKGRVINRITLPSTVLNNSI